MHTLRHAAPRGERWHARGFRATAQTTLPAEPQSAACVRGFTRGVLSQWGLPDLAADAVLAVSELAGNAIRAGQTCQRPEILIRLSLGKGLVFIHAGDHNPGLAQAAPARPTRDSEHGRGLPIVQALANELGWCQEPGWKIVWAAVPIPPARPHLPGRQRLGVAA